MADFGSTGCGIRVVILDIDVFPAYLALLARHTWPSWPGIPGPLGQTYRTFWARIKPGPLDQY
jgi:hypothetical protein